MGKHKGDSHVKFRYLLAPKKEDLATHDMMQYTLQRDLFETGKGAALEEVSKSTISNFDQIGNNEFTHEAYRSDLSDKSSAKS